MKENRYFVRNVLPALLWGGLIFVESSIPGKTLPATPVGTDKLAHIAIYFVFCWLSFRALRRSPSFLLSKMSPFLAVVVTVLYGFSDEFHQLYVPGRSADMFDLAADAAGGILFIALMMVARRKNTSSTH